MRRRVARGRGCFLYDVPYVGTPDRILAPCGQSAGRAAAQRVSRRAGLGFSLVRCGQSLAAGHSWFQVLQPLAHGPRPGCLVWRQPCRQRTVRKRGLHRSRAASYPAVAGPGVHQAAYIAEGIASRMGVPVEDRAVSRLRNNPSQTTRSSAGRWENVRDLFAVARPGALAGRHVLLVDDVVTTGSTLLSCTEALLRAVPDCRVSIAALAVSRRHFGLDR